jgi:hypothetical protein
MTDFKLTVQRPAYGFMFSLMQGFLCFTRFSPKFFNVPAFAINVSRMGSTSMGLNNSQHFCIGTGDGTIAVTDSGRGLGVMENVLMFSMYCRNTFTTYSQ